MTGQRQPQVLERLGPIGGCRIVQFFAAQLIDRHAERVGDLLEYRQAIDGSHTALDLGYPAI